MGKSETMDKLGGSRKQIILNSLSKLTERFPEKEHYCLIEIGAATSPHGGMSTPAIVKYMADSGKSFSFYSFELFEESIEKAKNLLKEFVPEHQDKVTFIKGKAEDRLPEILSETAMVHFAFIDGGGSPESNLKEYSMISKKSSAYSIILVDDIWDMPPTEAYTKQRPLGKGSMIIPELVKQDIPFAVFKRMLIIDCCSMFSGSKNMQVSLSDRIYVRTSEEAAEFVRTHFQDKKILIVGGGADGRKIIDSLAVSGIKSIALIEDYSSMGNNYNGVPVCRSADASSYDFDVLIMTIKNNVNAKLSILLNIAMNIDKNLDIIELK